MSATFNKFNLTVQKFTNGGNLNLATDTLKVMLTNTSPVATNSVYSDISGNEIANGNGYSTGGLAVSSVSSTNSSGTQTLTGVIAVLTATGAVGPFQWGVLYDVTASGALLGWWNNGSPINLTSGGTFTLSSSGNILMTVGP
jgi:hypothetical protein